MKKIIYKCPKCRKIYKHWLSYKKHKEKMHYKKHISYFDLVQNPNDWGEEFTDKKLANEFKKSANMPSLNIAYLSHIWTALTLIKLTLERIEENLKKPKITTYRN